MKSKQIFASISLLVIGSALIPSSAGAYDNRNQGQDQPILVADRLNNKYNPNNNNSTLNKQIHAEQVIQQAEQVNAIKRGSYGTGVVNNSEVQREVRGQNAIRNAEQINAAKQIDHQVRANQVVNQAEAEQGAKRVGGELRANQIMHNNALRLEGRPAATRGVEQRAQDLHHHDDHH